ncbi:hypothetical protein [Bradyrhizobium pachyrhizi]|uniref:hypothetical protein n=1 Tax=Bradyrhizobium pachyrhizi TaxID=280333 RepID=UPI003D36F4B6
MPSAKDLIDARAEIARLQTYLNPDVQRDVAGIPDEEVMKKLKIVRKLVWWKSGWPAT